MTLSEPEIGAYIVAVIRAAALIATAPVIGDSGVPVRARLIVVVALGLCVGANRPGVAYADVPLAAIVELAVGLTTGLTARFILARTLVAGQLIGMSLGLGFASQYDAHQGETAGVVSTLFGTIAGLAFLAAGGLEAIARAAADSPAQPEQLLVLGPTLVRHGTAALGAGLAIAAPLVMASLIANLGLAVLGRAAPSINVFSVSLAAVLLVGGLALTAGATPLFESIANAAKTAAGVFGG